MGYLTSSSRETHAADAKTALKGAFLAESCCLPLSWQETRSDQLAGTFPSLPLLMQEGENPGVRGARHQLVGTRRHSRLIRATLAQQSHTLLSSGPPPGAGRGGGGSESGSLCLLSQLFLFPSLGRDPAPGTPAYCHCPAPPGGQRRQVTTPPAAPRGAAPLPEPEAPAAPPGSVPRAQRARPRTRSPPRPHGGHGGGGDPGPRGNSDGGRSRSTRDLGPREPSERPALAALPPRLGGSGR